MCLGNKSKRSLNAGMIGLSEGNGHPFSWSAICNGYDPSEMAGCPFPSIPVYLANQKWPDAQIQNLAVTCIWTQELALSESIARACFIPKVLAEVEALDAESDVIIFARDDFEKTGYFLERLGGRQKPILLDKIGAVSLRQLELLHDKYLSNRRVFSGSAARYATEFNWGGRFLLDEILFIHAEAPKGWSKYAIHVIQPLIANFFGQIVQVKKKSIKEHRKRTSLLLELNDTRTLITTSGIHGTPCRITLYARTGRKFSFQVDSWFEPFRTQLVEFAKFCGSEESNQPSLRETETVVRIIEMGMV
jgi:hypothetical protein